MIYKMSLEFNAVFSGRLLRLTLTARYLYQLDWVTILASNI